MYLYGVPSVYVMPETRKGCWIPKKLKLQMVGSYSVVVGNDPMSLARAASKLVLNSEQLTTSLW